MSVIDIIDRVIGSALHNRVTGDTHAPDKLSTGCKTVILIYKFPQFLFRARMGDNCIEFLEELAVNRDIVVVSHYLHTIPFKFANEMHYINYDVV